MKLQHGWHLWKGKKKFASDSAKAKGIYNFVKDIFFIEEYD